MNQFVYHTRSHRMWGRVAAALVAVTLMTTFPLSRPAWGQAKVPSVGILTFSAADEEDTLWKTWMEIFHRTLANRGWIEGRTVSFEYRSAHSDPSRFSEAAEGLVHRNVDVIWATSAPSLRAAFAASRSIPIVAWDFTTDPVAKGFAQSYARPGGNVTGVFLDAPEFAGKWFELLKALVPDLSRVAVFWDPGPGDTHLQAVRDVTRSLDVKLQVVEVRKPDDIEQAFDALRGRPQALILLPSPMFHQLAARFAALVQKHRLPATSMVRDFADAGGLIAYGPDFPSTVERHAVLVSKILAGADPAQLPLERPTKFHLVVNLKTAKELGITIPQSILLRADEVIR